MLFWNPLPGSLFLILCWHVHIMIVNWPFKDKINDLILIFVKITTMIISETDSDSNLAIAIAYSGGGIYKWTQYSTCNIDFAMGWWAGGWGVLYQPTDMRNRVDTTYWRFLVDRIHMSSLELCLPLPDCKQQRRTDVYNQCNWMVTNGERRSKVKVEVRVCSKFYMFQLHRATVYGEYVH